MKKRIKSRPGLFGTVYYYDEKGNPVGKSRPGLLEGTRIYTDRGGRYVGKSRPGVLAKEVFTDSDNNHITSYDSFCGEVHFKNGIPAGCSRPGFFDSAYTVVDIDDEVDEPDAYGETCFEAREAETECCSEDESAVSQRTVVKNLQLFLLCLVICAIILLWIKFAAG